MRVDALRLVALLLITVTTSAGLAHLFALPNKFAATSWLAVLARGHLRRQWKYSHAAGAVLDVAALISFALALLVEHR